MRGAYKGGVHRRFVANGPVVAMVVRSLGVQGGGAFGVTHIDHRGQHVIVDLDQFGCVFSLLQSLGHHHGHMVAHVAHFTVGQNRVWRLFHGLAAGVGDQPAAGQAVDLRVHHIGSVQNSDHAGRGQGGCLVDVFNIGVRMRRAHKDRMGHVGQIDVVSVVTGTGQEAVVFFAAQ